LGSCPDIKQILISMQVVVLLIPYGATCK